MTAFLKVVPVKPSTRALYADHLASLTKKVGRCPVARLTKEVLTDRLASLKVGSTTQKIRLSSVGSFLGWCVREGHIDRNPVHRMTKPKGRSRGTSAIVSPDAHAKLLALAGDMEGAGAALRQAAKRQKISRGDRFGNSGLCDLFELTAKLSCEFLRCCKKQIFQPRASARQLLRFSRSQLIDICPGRSQQWIFPFTRPFPCSIKLFGSLQPLFASE